MNIFLSCVSTEFRSYRIMTANHLGALRQHSFEIKVQEDFEQGKFTLLERLADHIRECDLVIHLVGDACGARPTDEHVRALFVRLGAQPPNPLPQLSYTQWEYELAQRFDRQMLVYLATPEAARDCGPKVPQSEDEARLQTEHRARIEPSGKNYKPFSSHRDLLRELFYDLGLSKTDKANNLPFKSLGSLFKGREEFLKKLRETLGAAEHRGHQRVAAITAAATAATVHGLGGIGKTRAAVEYAHLYADDHTALLFVQADSPENLKQNLAGLCGPLVLNLAEKDEKETEKQLAAVLRWLQKHPGWFLILDNVDTEDAAKAVEAMLGRLSSAGQVLITSRIARWNREVESLALDLLDEASSTAYLLESTANDRRKETDDERQARELAHELGQLALALEQAAAYICAQECSFAKYRARWAENSGAMLSEFDELVTHYPKSVAITWLTSFQQLKEPGQRLLRILSWLAPDPIPVSLLEAGGGPFATGEEEEKSPEKVARRLREAEDALANLRRYSLATSSADKLAFTVHRLVQDVTRRSLTASEGKSYLETALRWMDAGFEGFAQDMRTWKVLEPLAPHVKAVATLADANGIADPTSGLMNTLALLLHSKAMFAEAEPLYRRAIAIYEESCGPEHSATAICLNNLASLLKATNRRVEAEPIFLRALAVSESSNGPDHPNVANALNNLAQLLAETNRLAAAEPLFRRALAIDEAHFGRDHSTVAIRLDNLALVLKETNRLTEAEPLMLRALAIHEAYYGPDHPEVAICLNNLASLLIDTNRLAEAERLFHRALTIDEACYGPDHPKIASPLTNLASLLYASNRMTEAEPLFRRALAIFEACFGPNHTKVSTALNNLAMLMKATGHWTEAEPLFRRALDIDEASYGHCHPKVATQLGNLASLLYASNRMTEAEPLFRRALAIDESSYGSDHPEVATDLNNLAKLLNATDRIVEAEPLFRRALEIYEASYGPEHPKVAIALGNLAQLLRITSRKAKAEPLMRRALAIHAQFERRTGHKHSLHDRLVQRYKELLSEMGLTADEIERRVTSALQEENSSSAVEQSQN